MYVCMKVNCGKESDCIKIFFLKFNNDLMFESCMFFFFFAIIFPRSFPVCY